MSILPDYVTGTITLTNGSTAVTGTGTAWDVAPIRQGDLIFFVEDAEQWQVVVGADATEPDELTLADPWPGATSTNKTYRIRFQPDGSRYSAAAAQIVEEMGSGNLPAFADLVGVAGGVPVFTGPGAMSLLNSAELVNGVVYNVMVDNIAARAAYNGEPEGFSVLVADVGDGRAALYSKASASSGDWTDAAYVTGPTVTVDIGDVDPLPYGSSPTVDSNPVSGGFELDFGLPLAPDFIGGTVTTGNPGTNAAAALAPTPTGFQLNLTIPRGEGFAMKGAYAGGTGYVKGDVVSYNGSGYIAKGATTGNLPTNATYWDLLVAAGTDGTNGQGFISKGAYSGVTAYVLGDTVTYLGSSYVAKGSTTGNLPTNPTYWDLMAAKGTDGADGLDGTGLVNSIVEGDYIAVDDTDPTAPIVSINPIVGSFTPTVFGGTSAGSGGYSTQDGIYFRMGPFVYFTLTLIWTTHTGTGGTRIGGFPFTPVATNSALIQVSSRDFAGLTVPALIWTGSAFRLINATSTVTEVTLDTNATLIVSGVMLAT